MLLAVFRLVTQHSFIVSFLVSEHIEIKSNVIFYSGIIKRPMLLGVSLSQQAWHRSRAQKRGTWKHFHSTPFSICDLSIQKRGYQVWQGCLKDSAQLAQNSVWILASLGEYLRTYLKDHIRYDRGPEIHDEPRRVSLPVGEAQLAGCLRVQVGQRWSAMQASSNYAQGVVQDIVDEVSISTATPDWRTVLSC